MRVFFVGADCRILGSRSIGLVSRNSCIVLARHTLLSYNERNTVTVAAVAVW